MKDGKVVCDCGEFSAARRRHVYAPGRVRREIASFAHQRPLKRQATLGLLSVVDATTGCGHMRVTAATMAAASSSVGTGEIDAIAVFID
jgi:predicted RNA methylase